MVAASRDVGLAEVLRRHGQAYLATHKLSANKAKVWRAIVNCRTAALGGQVETCTSCGSTRHVYRSCRNRHCPRCQTRAKESWLAQRRAELLPVPYFHLVFTLPHDLNGLVGWCPRLIYETLFAAVSTTLTEFAANARWLGGMPAFSLVLHTWKQDLGRHVHVHALMAGGALSLSGQWLATKRGFLFPVKALSKVFRAKFLATLQLVRDSGKLLAEQPLADQAWDDLIARLRTHQWVVYAKQPLAGPMQVLEYLGRYTHRVAISNERFLLHVLPKGFKRIRHYGLLGPARKALKLAQARAALSVAPPDPVVMESVAGFMCRIDRHAWMRCGYCGQGCFVPTAPIAVSKGLLLQPRGPP